jgi:predicted transcriptional regulator
MMITGKLIKEMRNEAGLSQAELARLARVSQAHVAKIEAERVDPRLSTVNRILHILRSRDRRKRCRSVMNPNIISTGPDALVHETVKIMHEHNISQIPVMDGHAQVGSIDEATIIRNMDRNLKRLQVKHIIDRPFPVVDGRDPVEIVQPLLNFHPAVLVAERGRVRGIITKSDLLGVK